MNCELHSHCEDPADKQLRKGSRQTFLLPHDAKLRTRRFLMSISELVNLPSNISCLGLDDLVPPCGILCKTDKRELRGEQTLVLSLEHRACMRVR